MLPQTSFENSNGKRTIYINPNFNQAMTKFVTEEKMTLPSATATEKIAINPLFLQAAALRTVTQTLIPMQQQQQQQQQPQPSCVHMNPTVHMNPAFIQRNFYEQQMLAKRLQYEKAQQATQNILAVAERARLLEHKQEQQRVLTENMKNQRTPSEPTNVISIAKTAQPSRTAAEIGKDSNRIIAKSRMRIVRAPSTKKSAIATINSPAPLISLSKRKLVRLRPSAQLKTNPITSTSKTAIMVTTKVNRSQTTTSHKVGKYKIDNRQVRVFSISNASPLLKVRSRAFVARYALRRAADRTNKANASTNTKTTAYKNAATASSNKTLQLLNINGVLYKSTRNKLQRKADVKNNNNGCLSSAVIKDSISSQKSAAQKLSNGGRALFVHGTKFIMAADGYKLTRVPAVNTLENKRLQTAHKKRQRIDIGGLTYVAAGNTQNVYICTRHHLTRAHVNSAKQRSLQLLSKNLVKSNIPCAIYQRIGKCVAFERGKCSKVHDKDQVTICPRFLRGECLNTNCLLSHNVSLAKMPVCKFFLQGVCVRVDCPYLHKKLSQHAEICEDFIRGFCKRAAQCHKRHEFLCPTYERTGKCELSNCTSCKSKKHQKQFAKQKQLQQQQMKLKKLKDIKDANETAAKNVNEAAAKDTKQLQEHAATRYFNEQAAQAQDELFNNVESSEELNDTDEQEATSEMSTFKRPKIGALPAFIPLT